MLIQQNRLSSFAYVYDIPKKKKRGKFWSRFLRFLFCFYINIVDIVFDILHWRNITTKNFLIKMFEMIET